MSAWSEAVWVKNQLKDEIKKMAGTQYIIAKRSSSESTLPQDYENEIFNDGSTWLIVEDE